MSYSDSRRKWRRRANEVGLTVLGLNGEVRPAVVIGSPCSDNKKYAKVCVYDEFADISFPIKWDLVKAIADGYVTQLRITRRTPSVKELLETRAA